MKGGHFHIRCREKLNSPWVRIVQKNGGSPANFNNSEKLFRNRNLQAESGQVLVLGLCVCIGLFLIAMTVANVGMMVAEKIRLQDTVDAAAYSAATVEARYMNLSAYINRAMVANYNNMAFDTALWATADATDHGTAVLVAILYQVDFILTVFPPTSALGVDLDSIIDAFRDYLHHPLHTMNHYLNTIFAQDEGDWNQYIEHFNIDMLSMYQGLLYAAMQSTRYEIQQEVATKMDGSIVTTSVLGLGAEAVSYDELAKAVDYVVKDPTARGFPFSSLNASFNKMTGNPESEEESPFLLPAVTEASLDRFAVGRDRDNKDDKLRNFANVANLFPAAETIEDVLETVCEIATLSLGDCNTEINLTVGGHFRDGYENKGGDEEKHVPYITRQRMREVNFFGIDFHIEGVPGDSALNKLLGNKGHTSGDRFNDVGNVANSTVSLVDGIDFERAAETIKNQGYCAVGLPIPLCGLNALNVIEASLMIAPPIFPPIEVDDHWDGSFKDVEPVDSWQLTPPIVASKTVIQYLENVIEDGTEEGVPKYDWLVDLDNVGFPNYHYPTAGAALRSNNSSGGGGDKNLLAGPSIAVVGVKPAEAIRSMRGLGIGNPYAMSAVARAQVYYVRNPNRPDETPSLFNPHWVPRLAPLESDDTPPLLRSGLPFVSSIGIPIAPTH